LARTLVGVFVGLAVMLLTVVALEAIGQLAFPRPAGLDFGDPEQARRVMELLPPGALFFVMAGWVAGTAFGACVAATIARELKLSAAMAIGAVMQMLVLANLVMLPHPWWMALGSALLPLPSAFLGYTMAVRRAAAPR
jgi:hypothetical protein